LGYLAFSLSLVVLAPPTGGCGEVHEPGSAAVAYFVVPRGEATTPAEGATPPAFTTLPWPNDIRLDPDGTVNLRGFPTPSSLVDKYVRTIDDNTRGWGTSAGVFFRFSAPLDPASLPASSAESLREDASVFLVNIDPTSPGYARRTPIHARFEAEAGTFIGENHLVLLPVPGWVLRPGTTYAAILTRDLRDAGGRPLRRDLDFVTVLSESETDDAFVLQAQQAYAPLRAYLAEQGRPTQEVLNAAVFTTQRIVQELLALREAVYEDLPAPDPEPADLAYAGSEPGVHVYAGTFEAPIYQAGEPPYTREGGNLAFDDQGRPVLQRTERVRFSLTVPRGEMPPGGWPVVLYAHGTGGDYLTHVTREGLDLGAIYRDGEVIAQAAMIGIDQVLHGTRCGEGACNPELDFFNFQNPVAARDNVRQGALDNVQLLRLVEALDVAAAPYTGQALRFDPHRILFMGHSQGGLTGTPFLAVEPKVKLAVLSGTGGNMIRSILEKTEPVSIPEVVAIMLGETEGLDEYHPVLSLIQLFIEVADPVNYGRYLVREPVDGANPKHVFLSQGLVDSFTPPVLTEALAVAAGLDLVEPWLEPTPRLELRDGFAPFARPVSLNLEGDAGAVTGVMLQYPQWGRVDGHFVLFTQPEGNRDYRQFVGSYLQEGEPRIYVRD